MRARGRARIICTLKRRDMWIDKQFSSARLQQNAWSSNMWTFCLEVLCFFNATYSTRNQNFRATVQLKAILVCLGAHKKSLAAINHVSHTKHNHQLFMFHQIIKLFKTTKKCFPNQKKPHFQIYSLKYSPITGKVKS